MQASRFLLVGMFLIACLSRQSGSATAQTIPPKPVYLAVGTSITEGLYASDGYGFARMIAVALPEYQLAFAEVQGTGIENMIQQMPAEIAKYQPAFVTIEVGVDDLGGLRRPFRVLFVRLLHVFFDAGIRNVVVCTLPWTGQDPDSPEYARALEYNRFIAIDSPSFHYTVADCWAVTEGHSELLSAVDGFHPNDQGHRVLANAFLKAVLKPKHWLADIRR